MGQTEAAAANVELKWKIRGNQLTVGNIVTQFYYWFWFQLIQLLHYKKHVKREQLHGKAEAERTTTRL